MTSELLSVVPKFPAADIAAAVRFYVERLGFRELFRIEDCAGLARGAVELHVWHCGDRRIAENTGCRIEVHALDALYVEMQAAGVIHPNGALAATPWGTREFSILDADGNLLTFFEPDRADPAR